MIERLRAEIRAPGLIGIALDSLGALFLAWMFPAGINALLDRLGSSEQMSAPKYFSAGVFLVSVLLFYGAQTTSELRRSRSMRDDELRAEVIGVVRGATQESVLATLSPLLLGSRVPTAEGVELLGIFAAKVEGLPPHVEPLLAPHLSEHLDNWRTELIALAGAGAVLPLRTQIRILARLESTCSEYLLIDGTLYDDVNLDWTPAFRSKLDDWASSDSLRTYVYLYDSKDDTRPCTGPRPSCHNGCCRDQYP